MSDYVLDCWVFVINESSSDFIFDQNCVFCFHENVVLETVDGCLDRLDLPIGSVEFILGDSLEVFDVHLVCEGLQVDLVLSWVE